MEREMEPTDTHLHRKLVVSERVLQSGGWTAQHGTCSRLSIRKIMKLDMFIQLMDTLYHTKRIHFRGSRHVCERPNF